MRLVFKCLVVVVAVLGITNYLIYLKTGQVPARDLRMYWDSDWLADIQEKYAPGQLAEKAKDAVNSLAPGESAPTKVFKWTDANGQVHYGDKPNEKARESVEVIEVHTQEQENF